MLPPVFNVLRSASAVVALVDRRIYRHGYAQQDKTTPYVAWSAITTTPENHLDGLPSHDRVTIQVDCYAGPDKDGDAVVERLARAVRDAIEPHAHMTGQPIDERESATKLWRMALQFDWFLPRPPIEPAS